MRAPDVWESARFTGFFLALSLYCSQAESQPAHLRLTQAVGRLFSVMTIKVVLNPSDV
jgi:hypothetical protein